MKYRKMDGASASQEYVYGTEAEDTINYLQPQLRLMLMEMPFYQRVFQSIVSQDCAW